MSAPPDWPTFDAVTELADELDRIARRGREALEAVEDGCVDGKTLDLALHEMALATYELAVVTENAR
jgi:hypothetical protein